MSQKFGDKYFYIISYVGVDVDVIVWVDAGNSTNLFVPLIVRPFWFIFFLLPHRNKGRSWQIVEQIKFVWWITLVNAPSTFIIHSPLEEIFPVHL